MRKKLVQLFNFKRYFILIAFLILLLIVLLLFQNFFMFFILGILLFFMILLTANYLLLPRTVINIDNKELEIVEEELKKPLLTKSAYVLTDHYMIIRSILCFKIVKYDDIVLVYKQKLFNGVSFFNILILVTNTNKTIAIPLGYHYNVITAFDNSVTEIEKIIRLQNNKILFGYNKKNLEKIKIDYGFRVKK